MRITSSRIDPRALKIKSGLKSRFATPGRWTRLRFAQKIARYADDDGQGSVNAVARVNTFTTIEGRFGGWKDARA
jgi:hypothetical protein